VLVGMAEDELKDEENMVEEEVKAVEEEEVTAVMLIGVR
jgi:hypothetical protein